MENGSYKYDQFSPPYVSALIFAFVFVDASLVVLAATWITSGVGSATSGVQTIDADSDDVCCSVGVILTFYESSLAFFMAVVWLLAAVWFMVVVYDVFEE